MKRCKKCGETKPLSEFGRYKDNRRPDKIYHRATCVSCRRVPPKFGPSLPKGKKVCSSCHTLLPLEEFYKKFKNAETWQDYQPKCKVCQTEYQSAYYQENQAEFIKKSRANYAENREDRIARERQRRTDNPGRAAAYSAKRYAENKAEYIANAAARRRAQKQQSLRNFHNSRDVYRRLLELCKELEELTGTPFHVDHILPMKPPKEERIMGLDVPWNYRVMTAEENLSKRNFMPPEHERVAPDGYCPFFEAEALKRKVLQK